MPGIALDHDLEIVDFLAEEVSIFGVSCIGSRGMAGLLPDGWLARDQRRTRPCGRASSKSAAIRRGWPSKSARTSRPSSNCISSRGRCSKTRSCDIGIVTAIAGITRIEIIVEGRADHAGTTPMGPRRDALAAASQLVLEIEQAGSRALPRREGHFAATVGEFSIEPNAANVVPSRVAAADRCAGGSREPTWKRFIAECWMRCRRRLPA